ncbi:MAG: MFS transporter, partial [Verrucomicrobia bacterium]|nr:MFS transporter [Cytophagales bacterium]
PNETVTADQTKYSWFTLLSFRQTWAFALGKLLTDPIWWFYLFWLPDFLESEYRLSKTEISIPVALVYTISTFGSIGGGWLPMNLINRGWDVFRARKTSMFIFALLVLPIIFAQILGNVNMWLAVVVIGIAASAHQAWSANIFTTVSDMFPKKAIASVTGIGGTFGALGGILLSQFVQKNMFVYYRSIDKIEIAYYIMFFVCGGAYLLAWFIMHLLVPKMKSVNI